MFSAWYCSYEDQDHFKTITAKTMKEFVETLKELYFDGVLCTAQGCAGEMIFGKAPSYTISIDFSCPNFRSDKEEERRQVRASIHFTVQDGEKHKTYTALAGETVDFLGVLLSLHEYEF